MSTARNPQAPRRKGRLLLAGGLASLMTALSACLPTLEIPFPEPTGPYSVGITQQTLSVQAEKVLTLDIWYPAASTAGHPRAPYTEKALNEALSKQFGMPSFLFSETPSYAHQEAPPAPGPHAVVIFNHGYASFSKQNAATFQELASHGYVVISLAHAGESLMAYDAAGKAVLFDAQSETNVALKHLQKDLASYAQRLAPKLSRQRQAQTRDAYARASMELAEDPQFVALQPQIRRWLADTHAVIAALRGSARAGVLREADPGNFTVMGHSLGGLVAMRLASEPVEGLRGIINLDGPWVPGEAGAIAPPRVPSLNLLSTHYVVAKQDLSSVGTLHGLYREGSAIAHILAVKGTAHYNFTDLNFVPALKFTGMVGPVDPRRMAEIQNQAIREFLQRTTRGGGAPLEAPLVLEHPDLDAIVLLGTKAGG